MYIYISIHICILYINYHKIIYMNISVENSENRGPSWLQPWPALPSVRDKETDRDRGRSVSGFLKSENAAHEALVSFQQLHQTNRWK